MSSAIPAAKCTGQSLCVLPCADYLGVRSMPLPQRREIFALYEPFAGSTVKRHTEAGTPQSLPGKLATDEPVTGAPADAEPPTTASSVDEGDKGAVSCGCSLWSAARSGVRRLGGRMGAAKQAAGGKAIPAAEEAGASVRTTGKPSVQSAHNTTKRAAPAVRKFAKAMTARSSRRAAADRAACQCAFCT